MVLAEPRVGDEICVGGHSFTWTPLHQPHSKLRPLLFSYDTVAADALDRLDVLSPPKSKAWRCPHGAEGSQRDLYALAREFSDSDETVGRLWKEISTVPEWVDWEQLRRGQEVVYQYSGQILMGLLYKSLVGGMGAPRVVETLSKTGGFSVSVCKRRLLETLQHFVEVVADLGAVQPGGKAFVSTVRVRLLHASVRRRLLQLEADRPGYFDAAANGAPINDLHTMGTVAAYTAVIVYVAMPRQGVRLSRRQAADYFALWRWVGYLLGAPVGWMATPEQTRAMMESISASEVDVSADGRVLANNIIIALSSGKGATSPRGLLLAQARLINGGGYSDELGIEKPTRYYENAVQVQSFVLMLLSMSYSWLPARMQSRRQERFQRIFNAFILKEDHGGIGQLSKFHFQYIPNLGQTTELGSIIPSLEAKGPMYAVRVAFIRVLFALVASVCSLQLARVFGLLSEDVILSLKAQTAALASCWPTELSIKTFSYSQ